MNDNDWDEVYPNFSKNEVCCKHCRVLGVTKEAMDALQALRTRLGVPLTINSGYRCPVHNKAVGGHPKSKHKLGIAFDISTRSLDKWELLSQAQKVGFKGFGFYKNFLHVDLGRSRTWGSW